MIRGRGRGGRWWALASLILVLVVPAPVQAQASLEDLRAAYRAARDNLDARLSARSVVENQWQAVLDSIDAATDRDDEAARDRAYLIAQVRSEERDEQIRLEEEAREQLRIARANLRSALLRQINELSSAYDTASVSRAEQLDALMEGYEQELLQLGREQEIPRVARVARITIEPIDRPVDICAKATLLSLRADQIGEIVQNTEFRIDELERRLRIQRTREDNRNLRERFDDVRVPVGGSAQSGTEGGNTSITAADSLGIRQPQTLEEEIQVFRTVLSQTESYQAELRGLVRNFISIAGGCGG